MSSPAELKAEILRLTREYSSMMHKANRPGDDPLHSPFIPGQTIPYAGRVFTEDEVEAAVGSTLDFWLTLGPEGEAMEKELAEFMGVKHCLLVNSGSSANLIALSALTTHKLPEHKRIRPGHEVITVAAGFPTTVTPIIQCGAVPVFIDAKISTGNADCSLLEAAYSPGKTKAVMMAHALGNPFELVTILEFCQKHDLWLIEDNCDALGCTYTLPLEKAKELGLQHLIKIAEKGDHPIIRIHEKGSSESTKHKAELGESDPSSEHPSLQLSAFSPQFFLTAPTGSFGDISTQSFYPPHHLTMGEGGAVNIIRKAALKTYAESFRDWGRDCWCASGKDDTCNKRFKWQLGELPEGYDHKYIYSHLGFNLKPLDPQAAIGRVQLKKLPAFIEARKVNWELLRRGLHGLEDYLEFSLPTHAATWLPPEERGQELGVSYQGLEHDITTSTVGSSQSAIHDPQPPISSNFTWDSTGCRSECSWFGFKITIKEDAPFTRTELAAHLDENKIGNRMLFGGNLVRQPAFVQLKRDNPDAVRIVDCSSANAQSAIHNPQSLLPGADRIMKQTLFLGTYPGLTVEMIDYMVKIIRDFVTQATQAP
jgi:CDP-6-deoxy-D-xylo-4-hexulose-3-dehydrase